MSVGNETALWRILQFQSEVARTIDDDLLETWPDRFSEPCRYVITTADNHRRNLQAGIIYADSRAMLADRVASLRHANIYERQTYRHILGLTNIVDHTENLVRAETPFMVARVMRTGETDLFATGRYLDVLRLAADTIEITERIVVCDSSLIDVLLALPL
jgi:anthranilate 1,2-dioxygenase small subunit